MKQFFHFILLFFVFFKTKGQSVVYSAGEAGYACFRIPAILEVNSKLLAFAEGRKNSCSDFGDVDIVLKTSSDKGKSWSELQVICNYGDLQAGNPAPVFDVKDPEYPDGRLFLFYNTGTASEHDIVHGSGVREVWYKYSTDDGNSWSNPENITLQVHKPNEPDFNEAYIFEEDWRHHANTPGHAIQLTDGRIYVPMNISLGQPQNGKIAYRAGAFFSDDHGESFRLADLLTLPGSNESTAGQLSDGEVILNARDQTEKTGKRYTARSRDGGISWFEEKIDPYLTDPVCEGSLLVIPGKKKDAVLLSQLYDPEERQNLSLHVSYDGARTWARTLTIDPESAAYSDLVSLTRRQVGILYEKDNYQKIVFKKVKL